MTNDPVQLATKIARYIVKERGCSFETIKQRAVSHGINDNILESALAIIHRNKNIEAKNTKNGIVYCIKKIKLVTPISHIEWVKNNYPYPDNFIMPFPEIDMSWIVLKGEALDKYKAAAKGMPYIPKKRYEHVRT